MLERHVVARAPGELGAETGVDAVLDVGLRCDVSNFLLGSLKGFHSWVQFVVLKHRQLVDVADVAHGLKLVEVLGVVDEVQHEVVLHRHVQGLHLLSLSSSLRHRAFNRVLRLHEFVVLGLDVVNNFRSVDIVAVRIPVDVLASRRSLVLVVVVKQTLKLSVSVTRHF